MHAISMENRTHNGHSTNSAVQSWISLHKDAWLTSTLRLVKRYALSSKAQDAQDAHWAYVGPNLFFMFVRISVFWDALRSFYFEL